MTKKRAQKKDDGDKKSETTIKSYRDRLKTLRKGQEHSQSSNIAKAVETYLQYLKALAMWYSVKETELHPKLFDKEKDIAELLLISHVYWDLAKAYDRNPNLKVETVRCLNQFVKFSSGYKFQHVNAKMIKNYVTRRSAHNGDAFRDAYKRIQIDSKGCFLATYCFDEGSSELQIFRTFKTNIIEYPIGFKFTELYYQLSPGLIKILNVVPSFGKITKILVLRPCLRVLSTIIDVGLKVRSNVYNKKVNH